MEDNNNQGVQGQNQEPSLNPQTNQDTNEIKTENTYWENTNQAQQDTATPQNEQVPGNTSHFYQIDQQQMNGSYPSMQQPNMTYVQPPKRKSHKGLAAGMVILILLLAIGGTAFAFRDTLANSYVLMTKSPAEYYAYVEKKAIDDSIKELTPYLNTNSTEGAYQTSVDITYDRDSVNSLLQMATGMSLTDLEDSLGIQLNSLGIDMTTAAKDGIVYDNMGLRLNDIDLITFELFMNSVKQELMMRFPELSPAYIRQALPEYSAPTADYTEQLNQLLSEQSADFMKRYGFIIVDNMNIVELTKNVTVSTESLSVNSNKLTITLDNKSGSKLAEAILEEAQTDEFIMNLLPVLDITPVDYQAYITEARNNLKDIISNNTDNNVIEMNVYVNTKGEIIGRDLTMKEDGATVGAFGYSNLNNKEYSEFNLHIEDEDGVTIVSGTGNQRKENGLSSGKMTLEINDPSSELMSNVSVDIDYENAKTEFKDNRPYLYGTYTFSSPLAMGIQLVVEMNTANDVQLCKLAVQMGASSLLTIDGKLKFLKDFTIPEVKTGEEIYEFDDIGTYLFNSDIEAFISNLSDKLGVDLQGLLDTILSSLLF
ncbi:MAG: hypothetical protein K0S76_898 [Herbinix sp.]|jgi:hypothetical protein|nr:hypothetical protein [Herbinix sp.]